MVKKYNNNVVLQGVGVICMFSPSQFVGSPEQLAANHIKHI